MFTAKRWRLATLASGFAVVSITACQDGSTEPARTLQTISNVAPTDAVAGQTEVIVLHGTKGRSARFVIRGGVVFVDREDGLASRGRRASTEELAFLRRAGEKDKHVQVLKATFKAKWAAIGLPDIDSDEGAVTLLGRSNRLKAANADRIAASGTPKRPSAATGDDMLSTMGQVDCTALFISLYEETQTLQASQQTLIGLGNAWEFYQCGFSPDPTAGFPSPLCLTIGSDILWTAASINWSYTVLDDIAFTIYQLGCM